MKDVLTSRKLHLEIRKRLVRCYVLSTFLYASEAWTLNKQMEDKINAFEMWIFRRMFRILHLNRKTNAEVLEQVQISGSVKIHMMVDTNVRLRIEIAKGTFIKMRDVLKS